MLHDAKSDVCQKIFVVEIFPGKLLTGNISLIKYATPLKKYFFGSRALGESIPIYG